MSYGPVCIRRKNIDERATYTALYHFLWKKSIDIITTGSLDIVWGILYDEVSSKNLIPIDFDGVSKSSLAREISL